MAAGVPIPTSASYSAKKATVGPSPLPVNSFKSSWKSADPLSTVKPCLANWSVSNSTALNSLLPVQDFGGFHPQAKLEYLVIHLPF